MILSQKKYALELLDKAHMANCNPTQTPVDTETKPGSDRDPISDHTLYCSLAGSNFMHPLQLFLLHIPMLIGLVALLPGGQHMVIVFSWEIIYSHGQPNCNILSLDREEIDIHFVRDIVACGQVRVLHVSSRY
nr:ribonuclease H-like domain-containing protein [Tanacetum cinerariifolium]